jgi:hypothetical protein
MAAGAALLLGAGIAAAAVGVHENNTTMTYPANGSWDINDSLVGSDTLNAVMDALLLTPGLVNDGGYNLYLGLGSSVGERVLVGGQGRTGEPNCAPNDPNNNAPGADSNPGCREIAPMSRELATDICEDDNDSTTDISSAGAPPTFSGTNTTAEGMAFCKDGLVVISDNVSLGQYGNAGAGGGPGCDTYGWAGTGGLSAGGTSNSGNSFPDRGVGNLRSAGTLDVTPVGAGPEDYTIGGGTLGAGNEWKDVLRIIYTGCSNTDGTCAAANDRVARCGEPLRTSLLANWGNIFEGSDCGASGNNCGATGLRKAYRRDDASGTTGFFLEALGVAFSSSANLLNRTTIYNAGLDTLTAMPANGSYCDGGHTEGWFPTNTTGTAPNLTAKFDLGDPIRKNCRPEDDLCAFDGKMPVVRSIKSTFTPDPLDQFSGFPKHQCTQGAFARKAFIDAVSQPVCPDGTRPNLSGCKFPYYTNDGGVTKNFDCLNSQISLPLTVPASTDGRSYNFVMHATDGTVRLQSGAGPAALPHVASWRENMAVIDIGASGGKAFLASDYVCREVDATRTIGCVVGKTVCTVGFAGREAAYSTANDYHLYQEPFKVLGVTANNTDILDQDYKLERYLWLNATHGFENLTSDCLGRNGSALDCQDELAVANAFYNTTETSTVGNLCTASGFVPLSEIVCRGATASTTSATHPSGCGAPTSQIKSECEPDGPTAAP